VGVPRAYTLTGVERVQQRYDDAVPVDKLRPHPMNANEGARAVIAESIEENGWYGAVVAHEGTGYIVAGNHRWEEACKAGADTIPVIWLDVDERRASKILAVDNESSRRGRNDDAKLAALLESFQGDYLGTGYDQSDLDVLLRELSPNGDGAGASGEGATSLEERFLVPPFSVLDARQGYWQERKRQWLSYGIRSELGRGEELTLQGPLAKDLDYMRHKEGTRRVRGPAPGGRGTGVWLRKGDSGMESEGLVADRPKGRLTYVQGDRPVDELDEVSAKILETGSGTSIFDPVLCELVYRWFCPPGGRVLDPFAGGSVRGVVAGITGRHYTGVDLSTAQVEANRVQGDEIWMSDRCVGSAPPPAWHVGDGRDVSSEWPEPGVIYDLVFTCPPYLDLEVYSDDPADLSRCVGVENYTDALAEVLGAACARLADDRFVVLVMGEARDKSGALYGLISAAVTAAERVGLRYYNEAILVTMVGSLPLRAGRQFSISRKLGRTHQTVLVFVKGNDRRAVAACGEVEVGDLDAFAAEHRDVADDIEGAVPLA
jgi:hypothetical protein